MLHPLFDVLPGRKRDKSVLRIAVKISGGIGDAVVAIRWLRDYLGSLDGNYRVDIYFRNYQRTRFLFSGIPGIHAFYDEILFDPLRRCYDVAFYISQFVDCWLGVRKELLVNFDPKLINTLAAVWWSRQKWRKYIAQHPHLDGAFANLAVLQGQTRETFIHAFTGVPYGGTLLPIDLGAPGAPKHPFLEEPYISVHDGWDAGFTGLSSRPTKALLKGQWPLLVEKIKKLTPLKIVQIGGSCGSPIEGVDLNLKGALSLQESAAVLKKSALHVDSESGLVHIAAALGTKSLVIFGPTNLNFFSYRENINIPPVQCGNCWWLTDDWMQACPANHDVPVCMKTQDLDGIAAAVAKEVNGAFGTVKTQTPTALGV